MQIKELFYKDLTPEQKEFICNGCGGKGGFINPPEFVFHDDCNHHDFNYWKGCSDSDREKYDKGFYDAMKKSVKSKKHWSMRWFYYSLAYSYYLSVRLAGGRFFNYSNRKKNINDLLYAMKRGV